jgi:hypothetical protein
MVTYYVALPFLRTENGGLAPGRAVECPHQAAANPAGRCNVPQGGECRSGGLPVAAEVLIWANSTTW